jgi:exonuclease VII large subunit
VKEYGMEKKTILNISLTASLLGILLLLLISENLTAKQITVSSITRNYIDKDVVLVGNISSINKHGDLTLLKIKDNTGKMDVVIFKSGDLNLKYGDDVEVYGKVAVYNDKLEIIAKSIKRV